MSDHYGYSQLWWDPTTGAEKYEGPYACNGQCLYGSDILMPGDAGLDVMNSVAYPHPMCALHGGHDAWVTDDLVNYAAQEIQHRRLTDAYFHGLLTEQSPYPITTSRRDTQ